MVTATACLWCWRNASPHLDLPLLPSQPRCRRGTDSHSGWMHWVSKSWFCLSSFRRYDNYKIGTFLLCQSTSRAFEVHVRQWDCGGLRSAMACNCGVAAREGDDVVMLDSCNGHSQETRPQLAIRSTGASPQVKILKAYGGRKITVRGCLSTLVAVLKNASLIFLNY